MSPPQVNATLTSITGATAATGGRDDWDAARTAVAAGGGAQPAEPADAGPVKWTGAVRCYYRPVLERTAGDMVERRTLIIPTTIALAAGLDTDDVVTFTVDGDATPTSARARMVSTPRLAGIPDSLQTARLELAPVGG
jgi:hypothetical protein